MDTYQGEDRAEVRQGMWMYFNQPEALEQLKREGTVYTLRKTSYEGLAEVKVGGQRTGIKVRRELVADVDTIFDLRGFPHAVAHSGFADASEWWAAALGQSGQPPFKLFRVTVITKGGGQE